MNKKLLLALALFSIIISAFTVKSGALPEEKFKGVWQLRMMSQDGKGKGTPQVVTIKIFGEEGTFQYFQFTPQGSAKTMEGTYRILNDSLYSESITKALSASIIGQTYEIKYALQDNVLLMSGSYDNTGPDGIKYKQRYSETWTKVDFPAVK